MSGRWNYFALDKWQFLLRGLFIEGRGIQNLNTVDDPFLESKVYYSFIDLIKTTINVNMFY